MFDAKTQKQIDDALAEQLNAVERKFIKDRADGLSLGAAWSCAGHDFMPGWQRDARDFERRLSKRRAEIELPYREQMRAVERAERARLKALEWERHRAATAPIRAELSIGLMVIIHADASAAIGADGRLDVVKLKASGIGRAIQRVRVGADGRLKSIQLCNKVAAARLLEQFA